MGGAPTKNEIPRRIMNSKLERSRRGGRPTVQWMVIRDRQSWMRILQEDSQWPVVLLLLLLMMTTCTDLSFYNYLLLFQLVDCTTNHRSIPSGYLLHLLVQSDQGPLVAFIADEVGGVGDKKSVDTTVDVQTQLEAFLNIPRPAPVSLSSSSGKKQNFWS
jgi:hypothetical protein